MILEKNNPLNPLNPRFIVPRLNMKQLGIPMDIGKIPKQVLSRLFRQNILINTIVLEYDIISKSSSVTKNK